MSVNLRSKDSALIVAVNTGLRRSEMLRLKVADLNFSNRVRFCRVTGNKDIIVPPNTLLVRKSKNGEHRPYSVEPEIAAHALVTHRRRQQSGVSILAGAQWGKSRHAAARFCGRLRRRWNYPRRHRRRWDHVA
jgi:integrase